MRYLWCYAGCEGPRGADGVHIPRDGRERRWTWQAVRAVAGRCTQGPVQQTVRPGPAHCRRDTQGLSVSQSFLHTSLLSVVISYLVNRSTQPGHPSVGRHNEYQRKLGRKQAHRAMHWPRIRGLAV